MNSETSATEQRNWLELPILTLSIGICIIVVCISCLGASRLYGTYQIGYDPAALPSAAIAVVAFAPVFLLFVFARFSFGYFVGFYLSAMVVGYLWLSFFSYRVYDHEAGRLSAVASAVLFLLPALFVSSPLPRRVTVSAVAFDRALALMFVICVAIVGWAATCNFRLVSPGESSNLRTDSFPPILNYLIAISSSALLPFLFACFVARKGFWQAGAVLALMLFYYPIAMTKTAFFAPAWLIVVSVLWRFFGAKLAVVLSLLLPAAAGVVMLLLLNDAVHQTPSSYFFNVNFRMIAVPSLAIDLYNEFFSRHELTHFCQIGILKRIVGCPYSEQLGVVMLHYFPGGGTYNASLFATEGIASVGLLLAPVSAFVCGLVIALGNRASSGLPPPFILVSSAILVQALLNVPLSTVLVTHGAALLFLLWYLTPREIFEQDDRTRICAWLSIN